MELAELIAKMATLAWRFAKTMPDDPHEYIVRGKTCDDDLYWLVYQAIADHGIPRRYKGRTYRSWYPGDGHYYWFMTNDRAQSIIINRAKVDA